MMTEKLTHEDFLKLVVGKQSVSTDSLVREDCPDRDGYILRVRAVDGKLSERMAGSYIGVDTPEGRMLGRSKVFVVPNDTWGCTLYPLNFMMGRIMIFILAHFFGLLSKVKRIRGISIIS